MDAAKRARAVGHIAPTRWHCHARTPTVGDMSETIKRALPTGTVTFLFTDIEGSTRLVRNLGDRFDVLLDRHHELLRETLLGSGGVEVATEGDSFFVAFPSASDAVAAAIAAQRALEAED